MVAVVSISLPSIVTLPAADLAKVVSDAWPNSIFPTPIELLVESAKESRAKLVVATVFPSTVNVPPELLTKVVSLASPISN